MDSESALMSECSRGWAPTTFRLQHGGLGCMVDAWGRGVCSVDGSAHAGVLCTVCLSE